MGLGAGSRQLSGWVRGATAPSQSSGLSQPPQVTGGRGESGLSPERSGDAGVAELADLGNKWGASCKFPEQARSLRGFGC